MSADDSPQPVGSPDSADFSWSDESGRPSGNGASSFGGAGGETSGAFGPARRPAGAEPDGWPAVPARGPEREAFGSQAPDGDPPFGSAPVPPQPGHGSRDIPTVSAAGTAPAGRASVPAPGAQPPSSVVPAPALPAFPPPTSIPPRPMTPARPAGAGPAPRSGDRSSAPEGRRDGVSAFDGQRVRVPGATLTGLPDAPSYQSPAESGPAQPAGRAGEGPPPRGHGGGELPVRRPDGEYPAPRGGGFPQAGDDEALRPGDPGVPLPRTPVSPADGLPPSGGDRPASASASVPTPNRVAPPPSADDPVTGVAAGPPRPRVYGRPAEPQAEPDRSEQFGRAERPVSGGWAPADPARQDEPASGGWLADAAQPAPRTAADADQRVSGGWTQPDGGWTQPDGGWATPEAPSHAARAGAAAPVSNPNPTFDGWQPADAPDQVRRQESGGWAAPDAGDPAGRQITGSRADRPQTDRSWPAPDGSGQQPPPADRPVVARATASARVTPPPLDGPAGPPPVSGGQGGVVFGDPFRAPATGGAHPVNGDHPYSEHTTNLAGRRDTPQAAAVPFGEQTSDLAGRVWVPQGGQADPAQGAAAAPTVTPPGLNETSSWPAQADSEQGRFDQFKAAEKPEALAPPKPIRKLPVLLAVLAAAVLLVAVPMSIVWLMSRPSADAFTVNAGDCVKRDDDRAVRAACTDAGAFQVVSKVDAQERCPDPGMPFVINPTGDGRSQVLCLKPPAP